MLLVSCLLLFALHFRVPKSAHPCLFRSPFRSLFVWLLVQPRSNPDPASFRPSKLVWKKCETKNYLKKTVMKGCVFLLLSFKLHHRFPCFFFKVVASCFTMYPHKHEPFQRLLLWSAEGLVDYVFCLHCHVELPYRRSDEFSDLHYLTEWRDKPFWKAGCREISKVSGKLHRSLVLFARCTTLFHPLFLSSSVFSHDLRWLPLIQSVMIFVPASYFPSSVSTCLVLATTRT